jgi:hypothetical protein
MSTVSLLSDAELSPAAAAVFADIRATRQTEFIDDFWPMAQGCACCYMLRRYCPPTSNSAFVICPSEHTRTASISTSNTLRLSITAC